jgi:hypothetical protein
MRPAAGGRELTAAEEVVVELFLGTLDPTLTLSSALLLAEEEVQLSRLSRPAARRIGTEIRRRFAR